MRQIGEDRRDLASIETMMNERIADAKADAEAKGRPISDHIAMLEQALQAKARDAAPGRPRQSQEPDAHIWKSRVQTEHPPDPAARREEKVKTIIEELLRRGMKECVVTRSRRLTKTR